MTRVLTYLVNDETREIQALIDAACVRLAEAHKAGRSHLADCYAREISALMSAKNIASRREVGTFARPEVL